MPGVPGRAKYGGRQKGTPNKSTLEIRTLLDKLFDASYFTGLRARLDEGKLPPAVEAKLLAYRYGEPKQSMDITGQIDTKTTVVHEHRSTV